MLGPPHGEPEALYSKESYIACGVSSGMVSLYTCQAPFHAEDLHTSQGSNACAV